MRHIIILAIAVLLVGCNKPASVPTLTKCSEGYNPDYYSTRNYVKFRCVKND